MSSAKSNLLHLLSDDELCVTFAQEVMRTETKDGMMRLPDEALGAQEFESWAAIPPFATGANLVLKMLARADHWHSSYDQGEYPEYEVEVWAPLYAKGECRTFARAACIALILAAREPARRLTE